MVFSLYPNDNPAKILQNSAIRNVDSANLNDVSANFNDVSANFNDVSANLNVFPPISKMFPPIPPNHAANINVNPELELCYHSAHFLLKFVVYLTFRKRHTIVQF
jgi:hypothetical protein